MQPGIRRGQTPPFHEIGPYVFQELCRDLHDKEQDVATCTIYGINGQQQYGIDTIARLRADRGIEVGQCKCYRQFGAKNIREASDAFFDHWAEVWSKEKIQRFVLFVACDTDSTQCQRAIDEQAKRFKDHGILYEVWAASTIRNKLRPHADIVRTYFEPPDYWASVICGTSVPSTATLDKPSNAIISTALENYASQLADIVDASTQKEIIAARAHWRDGNKDDALSVVQSIKSDKVKWGTLAAVTKAKVLRFEASICLSNNERGQALNLADQAQAIAPGEDDTRLRALLDHAFGRTAEGAARLKSREDLESRQLYAAFLIEGGSYNDAQLALNSDEMKLSAEGARLRALLFLLTKNISQSLEEIDRANKLEPTWETVRSASGIIKYYRSVSPTAIPERLPPWPEPISWDLVRRDDESQRNLRDASVIFADLASKATTDLERGHLDVWHMACLLNDPSRQSEGIDCCKKALQRNPCNEGAILWTVARSLGVDLSSASLMLERRISEQAVEPLQLLALVAIYLSANKKSDALRVIVDNERLFAEAKNHNAWAFWHAQCLVANGQINEALELIGRLGDSNAKQSIAILALRTNQVDKEIEHKIISELLSDDSDPQLLPDLCIAMARRGNWQFVAQRAEQLVEIGCTYESLRLAAMCCHNAGRFDACLDLIERNQSLLPQKRPPIELRRIRASCFNQLGRTAHALAETESIVAESHNFEDQWHLAHLLVKAGDIKRLALIARQIEPDPKLEAAQALDMAYALKAEAPELAEKYWHRAIGLELADDLVVKALILGKRLGLEKETRQLMPRLESLAQEGTKGVQKLPTQDVLDNLKRGQDEAAEVIGLYLSGNMPIHAVSSKINRSIAELYRQTKAQGAGGNEPQGIPLLIRHGGRPSLALQNGNPFQELWLDITAILLVAHLGVLDSVEQHLKPLRLAPSTILALLDMRSDAEHHQPSRIRAIKIICELIASGELKIFKTDRSDRTLVASALHHDSERPDSFETTMLSDGFSVDFLPTNNLADESPSTAHGAPKQVATCWSVARALQNMGAISDERFSEAIEALGTCGAPDDGIVPFQGARLYCKGATAELLAMADLLDVATKQFEVFIERDESERVGAELRSAERQESLARWIDSIVDRIRSGIEAGTYVHVPVAQDGDDEESSLAEWNAPARCMMELLKTEPTSRVAWWVDDRFLSAHMFISGKQTLGTVDVLDILVAEGAITAAARSKAVQQLREQRFNFLPLTAQELVAELMKAPIEGHVLRETHSLKVLRRSWATMLEQSIWLQKPDDPEDLGERSILQASLGAVAEAMVQIWSDANGHRSSVVARAEWLLSAMHVDTFVIEVMTEPGNERGANHDLSIAVDTACSLLLATAISSPSFDNVRANYLRWIWSRLWEPKIALSPMLAARAAEAIKRITARAVRSRQTTQQRMETVRRIDSILSDMPEQVINEINRDVDYLAAVGRKLIPAIVVGEAHFERTKFWSAAVRALHGQKVSITSLDGHRVALQAERVGTEDVIAVVWSSDKRATVTDSAIGALTGDREARASVFERHPEWFDMPRDAARKAIESILDASGPSAMFDALNRFREQSMPLRYETLARQLRTVGTIATSDLSPTSSRALLMYHRLDFASPDDLARRLDEAASQLIRDNGIEDAICRLWHIPVPLPDALIRELDAMGSGERYELLRRLSGRPRSFVSTAHLIRMLWRFCSERKCYQKLAVCLALALLDKKMSDAFRAFVAVLGWCLADSRRWDDIDMWASDTRLSIAWSHAGHVYSLLKDASPSYEHMATFFERASARMTDPVFDNETRVNTTDIAHPYRVTWPSSILDMVLYALGSAATPVPASVVERGRSLFLERRSDGSSAISAEDLLFDATLATNAMGTFLGKERSINFSTLVSDEESQLFSHAILEKLAAESLQQIRAQVTNKDAWATMWLVVKDLPIYDSLRQQLEEIVLNIDFVAMFKTNPDVGLIAARVACAQCLRLRSEKIRKFLHQNWPAVCAGVMDQSPLLRNKLDAGTVAPSDEHEINLLLNLSADLALSAGSPPAARTAFAELLSCISNVLAAQKSATFKEALWQLCVRLPPSRAAALWPTLTKLRSRN